MRNNSILKHALITATIGSQVLSLETIQDCSDDLKGGR